MGVGLLPKPHAVLTDADVVDGLNRACAVIDPLLDLLSDADPIGLRRRSHRLLRAPRGIGDALRQVRVRLRRRAAGRSPSVTHSALNAGAWLVNAADMPGTASWERMDRDARVHWWVHRVGALDNLVVASPGMFGWLNRVVPVGDLAGFINQAVVLCAVAREYGVTDRASQVRLLAEVLCGRTLPADFELTPDPEPQSAPESPPPGFKPLAAITESIPVVATKAIWQLAGILRAIFDEVAKRPRPRNVYRWLSVLPGLGAVSNYLGERDALVRAAAAGQSWLAAHRDGLTATVDPDS